MRNLTLVQRLLIAMSFASLLGVGAVGALMLSQADHEIEKVEELLMEKYHHINFGATYAKTMAGDMGAGLLAQLPATQMVAMNGDMGAEEWLQHLPGRMREVSDFKNLKVEITDAKGNIMMRTWDKEGESAGKPSELWPYLVKNGFHTYKQLLDTKTLGLSAVAIAPVKSGNKVIGSVALYQGLGTVVKYVKQNGADAFFFVERDGKWIPAAKEGKWFNWPLLKKILASGYEPHPGKTFRSVVIWKDWTILDMPYINLDHKVVARKWFVLPREQVESMYVSAHKNIYEDIAIFVFTLIVVVGIVLLFMYRDALKPIKHAERELDRMVSGDLSRRIDYDWIGAKDMREFVHNLSRMRLSIGKLIGRIQKTAGEVASKAGRTYDDVTVMCEIIKDSTARAKDTASRSSEVANMAEKTAQTAEHGAKEAKKSSDEVERSIKEVDHAVCTVHDMSNEVKNAGDTVEELVNEIDHINEVLSRISDISEQTNLLALNAAIEAARAGEHGRGFAVVADEVRALAGKAQETVDEVSEVIERFKSKAATTQSAVGKVTRDAEDVINTSQAIQEELGQIARIVERVGSDIFNITHMAGNQQGMSAEMREHMKTLEEKMADLLSRAGVALECFEQVRNEVTALKAQADQFKVEGGV